MGDLEAVCSPFVGGYEGVVKRFASAVQLPLAKLPFNEAHELAQCLGLSSGELWEIPQVPKKYFKSRIIQTLTTFFRINVREVFKLREMTSGELQSFVEQAGAGGLVQAAGADTVTWSDKDRIALSLILAVLRLLESIERESRPVAASG